MPGSHVRAVFGEPKKIFVRIIMNIFEHVDVSSPKKQGNVGEARAVYEYTQRNFVVSLPLSDSDKYDMIIDDGSKLYRVQVKTSRYEVKPGVFEVNLRTSGGNRVVNTIRKRQHDDYDLLFVLVTDGRCWSIPVENLGESGHSIRIGSPDDRFQKFYLG